MNPRNDASAFTNETGMVMIHIVTALNMNQDPLGPQIWKVELPRNAFTIWFAATTHALFTISLTLTLT